MDRPQGPKPARATDRLGARLWGNRRQQGPRRISKPPTPGWRTPGRFHRGRGGARPRQVVPRPGREEPRGLCCRRRPRSSCERRAASSRPRSLGPSGSASGGSPETFPCLGAAAGPASPSPGRGRACRPSAPTPTGPQRPAARAASAHASGSLPLTIFVAAVAVTREGELAGAESAERPSHGRGTERPSEQATRGASLPGGGCTGARLGPKRDCARHALPAVATQPAGQAAPCPESRRRVLPHVRKTRGPGPPLISSGLRGWGLPPLVGTRRQTSGWHLPARNPQRIKRGRGPLSPPTSGGGGMWRPAHCAAAALTWK